MQLDIVSREHADRSNDVLDPPAFPDRLRKPAEAERFMLVRRPERGRPFAQWKDIQNRVWRRHAVLACVRPCDQRRGSRHILASSKQPPFDVLDEVVTWRSQR